MTECCTWLQYVVSVQENVLSTSQASSLRNFNAANLAAMTEPTSAHTHVETSGPLKTCIPVLPTLHMASVRCSCACVRGKHIAGQRICVISMWPPAGKRRKTHHEEKAQHSSPRTRVSTFDRLETFLQRSPRYKTAAVRCTRAEECVQPAPTHGCEHSTARRR